MKTKKPAYAGFFMNTLCFFDVITIAISGDTMYFCKNRAGKYKPTIMTSSMLPSLFCVDLTKNTGNLMSLVRPTKKC